MPTLHQVTAETKSVLKWLGIVVGSVVLLIILINIGKNIKEHFYPTPPVPPTVTFGKLPKLVFPNNVSSQNFSYQIDTISGLLPEFPDRAVIHQISYPSVTLSTLNDIETKVAQTEFTTAPQAESETIYSWSINNPFNKTLVVDLASLDFHLTSNFIVNPPAMATNNADSNVTINLAKNFINTLSVFPDDIDQSKTQASFFTIENNMLVPAVDISHSQITRVDFWQKDVEKLPIFYPNPTSSTMNFLFFSDPNNPQIAAANFAHRTISPLTATYPLKTAQQAYLDLTKHHAYIASYTGQKNQIIIRDVSLGYYLDQTKQAYLMPIIVFKGDDNFIAYVSAVSDQWLSK